jgi:hypothetical protein
MKSDMKHYVYLIGNLELNWFKIGRTTNPKNRLKGIQHGVPFPVEMFHFQEAPTPSDSFAGILETDLLSWYHATRLRGEWYSDINVCEFPRVVTELIHNIAFVSFKGNEVVRRMRVLPNHLVPHNNPLVRRKVPRGHLC